MAGKWSAEETALLKELLTAHTVREARQKLGRSEYAVRKQMRKLKDSKDPVRYEDMNREDGENIRRMYKRAENKVERLKILKDLYPSYTKETIWQRLKPRPEPVFNRVGEHQETEPAEDESLCADEYSKPAVDEKAIKAAAFDVITNQMSEYPCSNTDTMMRFIQGVQALAGQLCEE